MAKLQKIDREIAGLDEPCLIGWHSLVVPMCGGKGAEVCPIKSFYYRTDVPFMRAIQ